MVHYTSFFQVLLVVGGAYGQACLPCQEVTEGPLKGTYVFENGATSADCTCVYKGPDSQMYCMQPNGLYNTLELNTCPGSRTFLAGLAYSFNAAELASPYCTGTIIGDKWILTSAACSLSDQKKIGLDKVTVLVGEENLGNFKKPKVVSVAGIYYPSTFDLTSKADNIALWKLSETLDTNIYTPLCLPTKDSTQTGRASLVGWRLADTPGALSEKVVEVPLNIPNQSSCPDKLICTESVTQCQGDFGGPLVQSRTLIGLVARDSGCSSSSSSSTFTQTSKHIDWISKIMDNNGGGSFCTTKA